MWRIVLVAIPCILPVSAVLLTAKSLPGAHVGIGESLRELSLNLNPLLMFANLQTVFWTYWHLIDLVMFVVFLLVLLRRKGTAHCGLTVAFLFLLVLSCLSPIHAFGTGWIAWRFPIMAALVFMVMIRPSGPAQESRAVVPVLLLLALVTMSKTVWTGYNWWRSEEDVGGVRAIIGQIPPGAVVLPVIHDVRNEDRPLSKAHRYYAWNGDTFRHLPTLVTPLAGAVIPTLFTAEGKQPLTVKPDWRDRAVPETSPMSVHALQCRTLRERDLFHVYLDDWRSKYDFVLVVNADLPDRYTGFDVPPGLDIVATSGFAALYRVNKAFGASDGPFYCVPQALDP